MKILTAAQMREMDRKTIEAGIPSLVLMENAAHRVVEVLEQRYAPLSRQRIVVVCGKGNNGGDGLAIARLLAMRFSPRSLDVVLQAPPEALQGDALANAKMLAPWGIVTQPDITPNLRNATLVVDAVLGTGLKGPAQDRAAYLIEKINEIFLEAAVVAVDLPSGMLSDQAESPGPVVRADVTVTFTAPKLCMALAPNCERVGKLIVAPVGTPPALLESEAGLYLSMIEPAGFGNLFLPRAKGSHKGDFGHVMVVGGSVGKSGAAAMAGVSALRAGAGLVTVASAASAIDVIAGHSPELMTAPLLETNVGSIAPGAAPAVDALAQKKSVVALGPGLGAAPETMTFAQTLWEQLQVPLIVDADGINALAGTFLHPGGPRIITPHPGEMSRFMGISTAEVQQDRIGVARDVALDREITVVLKGQRTIIAFPDGRVWVNPTGSPAMATGGTGDVLTGLMAGLMAQFPSEADYALAAAVWLHGRTGELGAADVGEKYLLAMDLLRYLPAAMRELEAPR